MSEKMNVLFIMTDQHRADHMSCSGNPILKTPNLDKFASECVRFTNAFCTSPMCMPNRATLLTGVYPNVHGVRSNGINLPLDIPIITQTLVKKGWYTVSIGKTHFNFWTPPYVKIDKSAECWGDWVAEEVGDNPVRENFPIPYYGFEEAEMITGHGNFFTGHYLDWLEEKSPIHAKEMKERFKELNNFFLIFSDFDLPEELYNTTYVTERTIAFLERYAKGDYGNKPFFLHCSFPDPHYPLCPPGRYKDIYKPDEVELPKSFNDMKNLYNHPFLGPNLIIPPFRGALIRETTEEETRKFIALTYGSIAMIDHSIGLILASLEKLGLADNTMVIYTSDHGDFMGDHGMILKGPAPFNGVLQVPLMWKVPGMTKPGVADSLVSSIDIPKTILNLLKIRERYHPPDMRGVDISPVLQDPNKKVRDYCLIVEDEEVGPKGPLYCRLNHLVTDDYKLTVYEGVKGYGDLYECKNDPDELNNLWNNEKFKDVKIDLLDKLIQENLRVQSRYPKRVSGV